MRINRCILFNCFLFVIIVSFGQSSKRLKNKQLVLKKQINITKQLIDSSQFNQKITSNNIELLQSKIELKQELLTNIKQQIVLLSNNIKANETSYLALSEKNIKLKEQLKKIIKSAYKYRNKYDNLIYIFSAKTFYEAHKRTKYIQKFNDFQIKQIFSINKNKKELMEINNQLKIKKKELNALLISQQTIQNEIQNDQILRQKILKELKKNENELLVQLKNSILEQEKLEIAIQKALEIELKKAKEIKKKKANLLAIKNKEKLSTSTEIKKNLNIDNKKNSIETNFASKKGNLTWPVDGTITKKFGKQAHPIHRGVYTNNNGIDIKTRKNAIVKSIFKGRITSILVIPGAGKVVIVAHGNYRTIYSNLKEVYVKKNQEIKTNQKLGILLPTKNTNTSTSHIEIHIIKEQGILKLNPSNWLKK